MTDKNIEGAPDLLVEIVSPSTAKRDETLKRQRYEALGVAEYWLIHPDQQWVRVYRRAAAGYEIAAQLGGGDTLTTPLLPGLAIAVAEIFS